MMTSAARPFRGPWIIAGCFLTFGVASGFPYYNISFFFDYFRTDHGWTQQAVTLGAPLAVLLTIWAGPDHGPALEPSMAHRDWHWAHVPRIPMVRTPQRIEGRVLRRMVRVHARVLSLDRSRIRSSCPTGTRSAADGPWGSRTLEARSLGRLATS